MKEADKENLIDFIIKAVNMQTEDIFVTCNVTKDVLEQFYVTTKVGVKGQKHRYIHRHTVARIAEWKQNILKVIKGEVILAEKEVR